MASSASATRWQFAGDYFENCNCDVVCPCVFSTKPQLTAQPTQGVCDVAFGFHIERGRFGDVPLDGLNVAMMAHTPGPMADGNWTVALYLDERADEQQRQALQAIFTGQAGGTMGEFVPLIGNLLGIKFTPISFQKDGMRRSLEIPGLAHLAVRAVPGGSPDKEMWAVNAHSFNLEGVAMAAGEPGSTWEDYGMRWDNSGKNAHYAPISWSNA
jgi:hypothetical protein